MSLKSSDSSLGVVLPVYKIPEETVISYVKELNQVLNPESIILEIDGEDEFAEGLELPDNLECSINDLRRGKGKAVSEGFDKLETDIYMFLDADASVPAESAGRIVENLESSDMVVGTRRGEGSDVEHKSFIRRFLGDILVVIAQRTLDFSLTDYQCGAKALKAETWENIEEPSCDGFSWDLELIQNMAEEGFDVKEVSVDWIDRKDTTVSIVSSTYEMILTLIKIKKTT